MSENSLESELPLADQKIKTEIEKLRAETENIKKPFITQILNPSALITMLVAIIGIGATLNNCNFERQKADLEVKQSTINKSQAELDRAKIESATKELDLKLKAGQENLTQIDSQLKQATETLIKTNEDIEILKAAAKQLPEGQARNEIVAKTDALSKTVTQLSKENEQNKQSSQDISKDLATVKATLPTRIYIQITDRNLIVQANSIAQKLRKEGYTVPGIEMVKSDLGQNQIRYFRSDDIGKANEVKDILKKVFKIDSQTQPISITNSDINQLEIWLVQAS